MLKSGHHTFSSVVRQLALLSVVLTAITLHAEPPRVVLFMVVDQFLPEYLDASHIYTNGLKKLRDESAWYTQLHYTQVPTETAPGHATLLTGLPPSQTGVIGNDWYDRKTGKKFDGAQPGVQLAPTIGDRLKEKSPHSIVIALSGKERATNMMAGKKADFSESFFLRSDQTLMRAIEKTINKLKIGQDNIPDLVAVSFSATDGVGHMYGPDSDEMKQNLADLDKTIGDLLSFCERKFGADGFVVLLTSDHGVLPMPETEEGQKMGAKRLDHKKLENDIEAALEKSFSGQKDILISLRTPDVYLDRGKINSLEKARDAIQMVPEIEEVYMPPFNEKDSFVDFYRRSYFPGRSGDLMIRLEKGVITLLPRQGTGHGSPYEYDTHVPLLLWGKKIVQGRYDKPVTALDIAPTVAKLLDLSADPNAEGKPLLDALRK